MPGLASGWVIMRLLLQRLLIVVLAIVTTLAVGNADDAPSTPMQKPHPNPDSRGRNTAVALNYCRASFHRIRRYQSKRVLVEEQEKILNNLNLNGIGDEEVIKLYSSVLDEISRTQIADREMAFLQDKFKKGMQRQIGASVLTMGTQMALCSVEGAVRTGVNSWLDYRDLSWSRELDVWKVDKDRMQAVVEKSTNFLDTFWKLAQKNNIPDRWLVRGDDLDALEEAVREPEPEKRLRILRRMEPFMECYPPYWYYVARALQTRGQAQEAAVVYNRVADLAYGHFRKDDMLAASLANRAIIQEYLKDENAVRSAEESLAHSAGVWEANLMCAHVLERHGRIQQAEDAILRNLDVDLERPNSALALLSLYYRNGRHDGIVRMLESDELLTVLPVQNVLQCAEKIGAERVPVGTVVRLRESLSVSTEPRFGLEDVNLTCDANWLGHTARIRYLTPGANGSPQYSELPPSSQSPAGDLNTRFRSAIEAGHALNPASNALQGTVLSFHYPSQPQDAPPVVVVLGSSVAKRNSRSTARGISASPAEVRIGEFRLRLQTDVPVALTPPPEQVAERKPEGSPSPERRGPKARILDIIPLPQTGLSGPQKQTTPPPPEERGASS